MPDGWTVGMVWHGDHLFDEAERLEYQSFVAEGFCGTSDSGRVGEYEPWREWSVFHVVKDNDDQLVGVVRGLVGEFRDLPVGHFVTTVEVPPNPVYEYASLAVVKEGRSLGVAEALYRSVWNHAVRCGVGGLVAIVEEWLLNLLTDHYCFGFERLGPTEWYMGGHCLPAGGQLARISCQLPDERPKLWSFLTETLSADELAQVLVMHSDLAV